MVSVKGNSPHEGNFSTEGIRKSSAQFFVCFVETFCGMAAPPTNVQIVTPFPEIMNQIVYLKSALAIYKTC